MHTASQANTPRDPLRLTGHASVSMQQRGIPAWFLRLLIEHGKTTYDGHGALLKSVSKGTRRRLQAVLTHREYVEAERYFDVYAVMSSEEAVITTAHRTNRRFH